ncbi:NAD(P)/FAD-dependent oxidoreductase [Amorphus orientalis]|uniref:Glycine/D-amino acid oxidase-like deaminating enzyme n=1 Tax=Amorphus orientalis TaxID=649198 RepID=A0AAE4AU87_9HYPH|nr:FAD-dependent oxidoreductase [Amorphus orientalis]MDQ0317143.1 glycine/D-amino acid oxidase-like deaminating enzyme [Amorphus orientalis]
MSHALVVGAGVAGLATAWGLVKRGWTVTVLEKGEIPNPTAASCDHHRLTRWHYGDHIGYAARMGLAFEAWDRLWHDLGVCHYVETGVFAVSTEEGDWADTSCRAMDKLGLPHERISAADAVARFPNLNPDLAARFVSYTPTGGALMANRILEGLRDWLAAKGAEIRTGTEVAELDAEAGAVITASGERLTADTVVIAAGVGAPALGFPGAPDLVPTTSTIVYVEPPEDLADAWQDAPSWVDFGGFDDLWGIAPVEGLPPKLGLGRLSVPGDPETGRVATEERVQEIIAAYRGMFRDIDRFTVRSAQTNFYTTAPENRFVLRRAGKAVLLSADSGHGFKFGALSGYEAAEAMDEPGRFDIIAERMAGHFAG